MVAGLGTTWLPNPSTLGSVLAIMLFVATVSFLFSAPGVCEATAGGFPALSMTGGFLIKDVALVGISGWTPADARRQPAALSPVPHRITQGSNA